MAKFKNGVEEITEKQFGKFISSNSLVLVDFWASWCMPCLMMAPIVEELCVKMKKIRFGKINIDENPNLAEKFNVMSIPTLIVFKEGREVDRIVGSLPADILEDKVKKFV